MDWSRFPSLKRRSDTFIGQAKKAGFECHVLEETTTGGRLWLIHELRLATLHQVS